MFARLLSPKRQSFTEAPKKEILSTTTIDVKVETSPPRATTPPLRTENDEVPTSPSTNLAQARFSESFERDVARQDLTFLPLTREPSRTDILSSASTTVEPVPVPDSPLSRKPTNRRFNLNLVNLSTSQVDTSRPLSPAVSSAISSTVTKTVTIGHPARVVYAVLTGTSMSGESKSTNGNASGNGAKEALAQIAKDHQRAMLDKNRQPDSTRQGKLDAKKKDVKIVAIVPSKSLKKVKKQLLDPKQARKVVCDLKKMELPLDESGLAEATKGSNEDAHSEGDGCVGGNHLPTTKGYALKPLEPAHEPVSAALSPASSADSTKKVTDSTSSAQSTYLVIPSSPDSLLTKLPPTSIGGIGAIGAAKSGAFQVLADTSGALVRRSGSHNGMVAPFDAIGVFIYFWGFEITIPPPTIKTLTRVNSVQSTLFTFLQAFVVAGGAPELAPFIRYFASYVDMEFGGIKSQDRGHGVVVAATWLLPVALVPRPWDFPLD